jgi:hypothetical protein
LHRPRGACGRFCYRVASPANGPRAVVTINARTHVCARWSSSCTAEVAVVFHFFGLLPPWRLRASLAASCPNIWFFKKGACSRGGRVGYSSGCNIWGASCGCLLDRGQDGTFFCSSLAHALGLSRQASESLLLSQKGVWRVRRPVSGASKEILISGGLPSQTWLVCWGSKRPHPSAKHETRWKQVGGLPPPTFSSGGNRLEPQTWVVGRTC